MHPKSEKAKAWSRAMAGHCRPVESMTVDTLNELENKVNAWTP